ncbi:hypothetical protein COO91_03383 [Nostoc flagelliforme CCNUN1]|uniref:Uncharacterized protein n=1 Tax=Nostoc flagelliforme CCNUN1 TaxID=2038116 RepID=A0A2K8SPU9_9NOSO|nr:hypothetical protein [Nostoc flagelliforme]AUB37438.1 hypothetical protein COO91_03383 [Nostoc flagelliforme CCNUN1]
MSQLSDALTILATSPVAKDREAIARLEKASQANLDSILRELDNQATLAEIGLFDSLGERRKLTKRIIVSAGLMCSGLSCLITIWLRPSLAMPTAASYAVTPIGFITGAAASSFVLAEARRKTLDKPSLPVKNF